MTPRAGRLLIVGVLAAAGGGAAPGDPPARKTDLVEKARSRLVQLDVTVTGPPETVATLGSEDFTLKIGLHRIRELTVDRLCREPPEARGGASAASGEAARPALGPTSYLFYFDQTHLTLAGRQRALDLARELIPDLVAGGNRVTIVSSADGLETLADGEDDPAVLLAALDRLEKDRDQWDLFATMEPRRIHEVLDALGGGGVSQARNLAKDYFAEELWRAEKSFRRFAMVLGRFADVNPPKAVIYLADNMRSNAGEHYLRLFGGDTSSETALDISNGQTVGALLSFDRVVNEASSQGVRLYTVQAEGMVPSSVRVQDAQDTLAGLSAETGGRQFLNGVRAARIAGRILDDLQCLTMISFSPEGLAEDEPLPVKLKVKRPGVRARVRGRVVIQSESARLTSRLMAAFTSPGAPRDGPAVHPSLIPIGFRDGVFSALVQVAVPGSDLPASTWDLGASTVSRGRVQESSGRLTVGAPGLPVILQHSAQFEPGPFEIVAVAHDVTADAIGSAEMEGAWPRPGAESAAIGPIAVLQPAVAAIRREDRTLASGPVAFSDHEPLRGDRPTAMIVPICKSPDVKGVLHVERLLVGAERVPFPALEIELGQESCAVVRDVIPSNTMASGTYSYEIRILDDGGLLTGSVRPFRVREPGRGED